ncbi:MAG TPA: alpha-ketoacid dehydrogenase subunit beta [Bacillota bacterium]
MAIITYTQAMNDALREEMERDPRVFVMGQDVGPFGGIFGETRGLYEVFGPQRVIDTPISETLIVGAGVGAAITGMRPVAQLQFADFIAIAMDEVANKAGKWRYMHGGLFEVPLVIFAPIGAIAGAGPEHSQCPEAWLIHALGLKVVLPATPADAKGLLKAAIRDPNPVVYLPHKALATITGEVPEGDVITPIGQARIAREGSDVTVVTYSAMVHKTLQAAERAAAEGISVEVIDLRSLVPLDIETILASVNRTGRLIVAHEAPLDGGAAADIVARVVERAFFALDAPVKRVCGANVPIPQSAYLEPFCFPQADDILAAIRELAAGRAA